MKWLQDNPLGMAMAGFGGVLALLVLAMSIVWTLPETAEISAADQTETGSVDPVIVAHQVADLAEFEVINEKPVFNETLIHLPGVFWGVYIEVSAGVCPLTPLENVLRQGAGASGYSGSFVEHYVLPVVYPAGLSAGVQLALVGLLVLANLGAYSLVIWRRLPRPVRRLAA